MRLVGLDENLRLECLPAFDAVGHHQLLDGDIVPALDAEREDVHGDPQRTGLHERAHGIAHVLIAVGQEHQTFLAGLGKRRGAEPDGAADVSALAADDGEDLRVFGVDLRAGGGFQRGVRAEHQQPGAVFLLLGLLEAVDELARRLLLDRGNGVGAVENEENVHAFLRLFPLKPRYGEQQQQCNHEADGEREPAAPRGDLHVRLQRHPDHPAPRHRQEQEPFGMGELEFHERCGVQYSVISIQ